MKHLLFITFLITAITVFAQEKKVDFQQVNTTNILEKIAKTNPGTWSLTKNSDVRHYGLTDNDFFVNFGNDKKGKIGTATNVENADKIGFNYTAIHALIKENMELKKELEIMNENLKSYENYYFELEEKYTTLIKNLDKFEKITDLENLIKDIEMRTTELEEKLEQMDK